MQCVLVTLGFVTYDYGTFLLMRHSFLDVNATFMLTSTVFVVEICFTFDDETFEFSLELNKLSFNFDV